MTSSSSEVSPATSASDATRVEIEVRRRNRSPRQDQGQGRVPVHYGRARRADADAARYVRVNYNVDGVGFYTGDRRTGFSPIQDKDDLGRRAHSERSDRLQNFFAEVDLVYTRVAADRGIEGAFDVERNFINFNLNNNTLTLRFHAGEANEEIVDIPLDREEIPSANALRSHFAKTTKSDLPSLTTYSAFQSGAIHGAPNAISKKAHYTERLNRLTAGLEPFIQALKEGKIFTQIFSVEEKDEIILALNNRKKFRDKQVEKLDGLIDEKKQGLEELPERAPLYQRSELEKEINALEDLKKEFNEVDFFAVGVVLAFRKARLQHEETGQVDGDSPQALVQWAEEPYGSIKQFILSQKGNSYLPGTAFFASYRTQSELRDFEEQYIRHIVSMGISYHMLHHRDESVRKEGTRAAVKSFNKGKALQDSTELAFAIGTNQGARLLQLPLAYAGLDQKLSRLSRNLQQSVKEALFSSEYRDQVEARRVQFASF